MDTHQELVHDAWARGESCHVRLCCLLSHLPMLFVAVALILLIIAGMFFFSRLIDNIKDARAQVRRYEPCGLSTLPYTGGLIEVGGYADPFCKAYEELDRELTSWLTILTFAGALFGLIAPLIGYLLQQHSLKDERKSFNESVNEKVAYLSNMVDEANQRVEEVRDGVVMRGHRVNEQLGRFETNVIRSIEFQLVVQINQVRLSQLKKVQIDTIVIANIIICFDYLLECLIHWNNGGVVVRAKVSEWISHIKAVWDRLDTKQHEEIWKCLKLVFKPSSEFASRDVFLKILSADSDDFKWLEKFFEPFAPWKFS